MQRTKLLTDGRRHAITSVFFFFFFFFFFLKKKNGRIKIQSEAKRSENFKYVYILACFSLIMPDFLAVSFLLKVVVVVVLLFYAHGKHLRSCRDG